MNKKILICVPMKPIQARYVDFFRNTDKIEAPAGFDIVKEYIPGWFPHYNRNEGVNIARDMKASHIFFLDDDVICPPDVLIRLVKHDVSVVSANMLYRCPPFNAYMYDQTDGEGRTALIELPEHKEGKDPLRVVDTVGAGALLIKTDVFNDLRFPWWEINQSIKTDDILLCKKLKDKGIPIYYDLSTYVGHISECTVWPCFEDGEWFTKIVVMNSVIWTIPMAKIQNKDGKLGWGIGDGKYPTVTKRS